MNSKFPNLSDWQKLLSQIPIETVEFDDNGHYNAEKHPDFHDWMENG
ncbi:AbrB family transcriptional regulator [Fructilactobacillus hinvesii]|uniref:AbrB family transcriptional regulator n=1 Tax=Fructilactobacillus hinvesii TaxID=2940300 RepID=A0ABY5BTQ1_9LACO|nr:AbrB family transcriptional regulator [Fructilactobacillus hinvesii]USS88507.1 AbrB family transcriptional regulator [Fructilactobacillus hinvesii]